MLLKVAGFFFSLLLLCFCFTAKGQPETITINGNAVNNGGIGGLYQVIVINQRTSEGMMAGSGGEFKISVYKTDTVLVSASGFGVKKLCFHDSVERSEYHVTVKLDSIHYNLAEVKVFPHKNLKEINNERSKLTDVPNTDTYPDASILNPISLLYERFSRLERSKRKVAEMENEQRRRDLLKEMLHLYIRNDIISMNDSQFDDFIDYMNLTNGFIKNSTDYDLITTIKTKFEQYEKTHAYYNSTAPYTRYDK